MIVHEASTPKMIVFRVLHELMEAIEGLDESACFIVDDPDSLPPSAGDEITATVFVDRMDFDQSDFLGGGEHLLAATMPIVVTLHHAWPSTDEYGRASDLLFDDRTGLMTQLRRVLKVLANNPLHDLYSEQNLLREGLVPTGADTSIDGSRGQLQANFNASFCFGLELDDVSYTWPRLPITP